MDEFYISVKGFSQLVIIIFTTLTHNAIRLNKSTISYQPMMYDAPIKFRLTQHFGSAKVAFSQDSQIFYTLVHNRYTCYAAP